MHQPFYKDIKMGEYLMPWVRLHGSKDYLDMLLLLDEFPGIKQTFNLVPSLLEQLADYTDNGAVDRHLALSRKPAAELTEEEKAEIALSFFSAHFPTMIKPYPRYLELYQKCHDQSKSGRPQALSVQDCLDLQVWFNAVWIDPIFRTDKKVKPIYKKGKDFTEESKQTMLDFQLELLRRIVPAYRERRESGRIEVSFSPFYHPILPLLVDTDSARVALPNIVLPRKRFAHPEDADVQVSQAAAMYQSLFGADTFGMWPSEGSVSEAILPILKRHGVQWIASDEEIYYASVNHPETRQRGGVKDAAGIHQPYFVGGNQNQMGILFRDHRLSDKIGFVYSSWDPEKAATDFIEELRSLATTYAKAKVDPVVSVILDGENAWEYYANDGIDFLRLLYRKLEQEPGITTVLPSELFQEKNEIRSLPYLFAGSWISHNFRVWIGHEEDNIAWDLLTATRELLVEFVNSHPDFDPELIRLAWKEIYIAEGSDWCWWYGDEHQTEHFELFDFLFRKHLQSVWEITGADPPLMLMRPIRKLDLQSGIIEPTDFLTPIIDGRRTNYFEWFGAGRVECRKMGGAMHRADVKMFQILYGYDDDHVFFGLDFEKETLIDRATASFLVELVCDERLMVVIDGEGARLFRQVDKKHEPVDLEIKCAWDKMLEVAIPRDQVICEKELHLYFSVALKENEKIVERWPEANYIFMEMPKRGESPYWQV
jgi:alpha-amylase/alpha-mannosidase (GH57 family)